jgi:hypothetical protein
MTPVWAKWFFAAYRIAGCFQLRACSIRDRLPATNRAPDFAASLSAARAAH